MHRYSEEERDFIRCYARGHGVKEITAEFNVRFDSGVKESQIKSYLDNNKISTGRNMRFRNGMIPHNKGKKMAPETYSKCAPTMFQKGKDNGRAMPVGTVRARGGRNRKAYLYEKVADPNVWKLKHVLEWERHNGPVPEGNVLIFADGDTGNTDIENLIMITKAQLGIMNHLKIRGCDRETMELSANVALLKCRMGERKKTIRRKEGAASE